MHRESELWYPESGRKFLGEATTIMSLPLEEDDQTVDFERLRELDRYLSTLSRKELREEIRKARLAQPRRHGIPDSTELIREDRER